MLKGIFDWLIFHYFLQLISVGLAEVFFVKLKRGQAISLRQEQNFVFNHLLMQWKKNYVFISKNTYVHIDEWMKIYSAKKSSDTQKNNIDCCPKFATGLKCLNRHKYLKKYVSDHSVLLPKLFTHGGITMPKGQKGHSYTFWLMPIQTF